MLLTQIKGSTWLYRCDWCQKEFSAPFAKSKSQTHGCSRSCGSKASRATVKRNLLEKHGVENVSQLTSVREKVKKTSLERYGAECSWQGESVKKRIKETMVERYGHDSPWKVPEIRQKIEANNIERFGSKQVWGSAEIREKSKQTMLERYGVDNPQKSESIKKQTQKTMTERYGVDNPQKNTLIRKRSVETHRSRYGQVENPEGYSAITKKRKQTCLERYGVEHPHQSPIIQQKMFSSMKGNRFVSKVELRCLTGLKAIFGDVQQQVSVNGWMIDFYVPFIDTYVQFDGLYWHGLSLTEDERNNPKTKRQADIVRKWNKDREQEVWFPSNNKRLVRIREDEFKMWESEGSVIENLQRSFLWHPCIQISKNSTRMILPRLDVVILRMK